MAPVLTDIKAQERWRHHHVRRRHDRRWLLREALLDELHLLVHPIVVGDGLARLFPPDEPTIPLELVSAETFKSGVLNLSYAPARD